MSPRHEFLHPSVDRAAAPAPGAAGGFDYPATEVGTAGSVSVYYATSLGSSGEQLATGLLGSAASLYDSMATLFATPGGQVSVVVSPLSAGNDGTGGGYHYGCDFTSGGVLYLDSTTALGNAGDVLASLYVAELSECFMGAQGKGWGCGYSNGEGLSRYCAETLGPPGGFPSWGVTGPSWVSAGYPDWVDQTEQTDRDYSSTGCAVLYIYWMVSQGYTPAQVVQAAGATLADNYSSLTSKTTAYPDLKAAVQAVSVTSDDPFAPAG